MTFRKHWHVLRDEKLSCRKYFQGTEAFGGDLMYATLDERIVSLFIEMEDESIFSVVREIFMMT